MATIGVQPVIIRYNTARIWQTVTVFTAGWSPAQRQHHHWVAPGAAAFEIQPTSNLSTGEITFDYWHSAALAPGPGNQLSDQLRFIFPTEQMTVQHPGSSLPRLGSKPPGLCWQMGEISAALAPGNSLRACLNIQQHMGHLWRVRSNF